MCHCRYPQAAAAAAAPDTDLSSKIVSSSSLLAAVLPPGFEFIPPLEKPAQTAARLAKSAARAQRRGAAVAGG
eukprot:scaffold3958_cov103-Isochrysis_galbana.AAC.4